MRSLLRPHPPYTDAGIFDQDHGSFGKRLACCSKAGDLAEIEIECHDDAALC